MKTDKNQTKHNKEAKTTTNLIVSNEKEYSEMEIIQEDHYVISQRIILKEVFFF